MKKSGILILLTVFLILGNVGMAGATVYLSDTGWSDPAVGTWDPVIRTGTLKQDLTESIQITDDSLTMDGNGKTVSGYGVDFGGRAGVTVKNLTISGAWLGIRLDGSNNLATDNTIVSGASSGVGVRVVGNGNRLQSNQISGNWDGIAVADINNEVSENSVTGNASHGIILNGANSCLVSKNTVQNNGFDGISLIYSANNNTIIDNTSTGNNSFGIFLSASHSNVLSKNYSADNRYSGLELSNAVNNTVKQNTFSVSFSTPGISFYQGLSDPNWVYNNNFLGSPGLSIGGFSAGLQIFYLASPIGGNYFSGWTGPDTDNDGFVDAPAVFYGGQDNFPWTVKDGWLAPVTTSSASGTAGNNGWYKSTVDLTLASVDNQGFSGVAGTQYSYNQTDWFDYTGPIQIVNESTTSIYYRSTTNDNHVERVKRVSTKIDLAPPTTVAAAATALSGTSIRVSWSSANDAISGLAAYVVERSLDHVSFTPVGSTTATSFDDNGLSPSTRYYYRVVANDNAGLYSVSSVVSAKTKK